MTPEKVKQQIKKNSEKSEMFYARIKRRDKLKIFASLNKCTESAVVQAFIDTLPEIGCE